MDYQEQRTTFGRFMYNLTMRAGKCLIKHRWLYFLLSYTWGIVSTLVSWIIWPIIAIFAKEVGIFGPSLYAMIGKHWGGLELGVNFLIADSMGWSWTLHTKQHEHGHSYQAAIFGPFVIFLSFIPSIIRYWQQVIRQKKGKANKAYDAAWFEGSATDLGKIYYDTYLDAEDK